MNTPTEWGKDGYILRPAAGSNAERYADDILMAMPEDDWRALRQNTAEG